MTELCRISGCPQAATGQVSVEFTRQHGPSGGEYFEMFALCDQHQPDLANGGLRHGELSRDRRYAES